MSIHYTPLNSAVERMAHLAQWTLKKARSGQLVLIFCEEKERRLAAEWIAYQLKEQFEGLKKLAIEVIHPYDKNDQLLKIFDKRKKIPKNTWNIVVFKEEEDQSEAEFYSPDDHLLTITLSPKAWTEHLLIEASGTTKPSLNQKI